jgi:alpha-amylase
MQTLRAPSPTRSFDRTSRRAGQALPKRRRDYCGNDDDILLQGFHWDSHAGVSDPARGRAKSWYQILQENADAIRRAGFSWVWFPPPSDSLAPEDYLPRRWDCLDTAYGTEAELRAAIEALGPVRAMADVVVNHRVGVATGGADFAEPPFPDNRAAVVADDSSGVGLGRPGTGGELFHAARNLDHTNSGVRAAIVEYLRRLRGVGFAGFRYDFVKGYHGRFVGDYNDAAQPRLSVGELFETDVAKLTAWLAATDGRSTAFDFPGRYLLYEAIRADEYGGLARVAKGRRVPCGLIGRLPGRAVTFLDNHDTEYRRDLEHCYANDGTRHFAGDAVAMGYAYLLTHPGMPCVFWPHLFDWGVSTRTCIERLLMLRRRAGVHARSSVEILEATSGLYAAVVGGRLAVKLGRRNWCPGRGWRLALEGERMAVWTWCLEPVIDLCA